MPTNLRLAAVAALVAVLGVGALTYFGGGPDVGGRPTPLPSPTVAPTRLPSPTPPLPPIETTGWIQYESSRYGYRIAYPPTAWTATAGDRDWSFETDIDAFDSTAPDRFETQGAADGLGIRVSVWTDTLAPGTTQRGWITDFCEAAFVPGSCTDVQQLLSEVLPGGAVRVLGWKNPAGEPMAAFVRDETIYVLAIWRSENDPSVRPWGGSQRLLEAFITTLTLPGSPRWESPAAS